MRLTLELDAKLHRQIKTLAAYHGQTIKGFNPREARAHRGSVGIVAQEVFGDRLGRNRLSL